MPTDSDLTDLQSIANEINENLSNLCESFHIPGISIMISKHGAESYDFSYGLSDIEKKTAVKRNTIFKIASITKVFTAIGICQLYEKGLVDFDIDINHYLSGFVPPIRYKTGSDPITLRHLLTHTSGIGELQRYSDLFRHGFNINVKGKRKIPPLKHFYRYGITTKVKPGTKYSYSNIGMGVVGLIIESVSKMSYRDYIKKHILDPLGMKNTDFLPNDDLLQNSAKGYLDNRNKGKYKQVKPLQTGILPAGNGSSTVEDLTILAQCILNEGQYKGIGILNTETVNEMVKPWFQLDKRLEAMGCGVFLEQIANIQLISHTGATSGFMSGMTMIKDSRISVVTLSNIDEIFANHGTLRIHNLIVQRILKITPKFKFHEQDDRIYSAFERIKEYERKLYSENSAVSNTLGYNNNQLNDLKKFCGYYRPSKGMLTNTRVYMMGFQFKIAIDKKSSQLKLTTLRSQSKNPTLLSQFDDYDPNYFYYEFKRQGSSISQIEKIIFEMDDRNKVKSLLIDKIGLHKKRFWSSILGTAIRYGILLGIVIGILFVVF